MHEICDVVYASSGRRPDLHHPLIFTNILSILSFQLLRYLFICRQCTKPKYRGIICICSIQYERAILIYEINPCRRDTILEKLTLLISRKAGLIDTNLVFSSRQVLCLTQCLNVTFKDHGLAERACIFFI